MSRPKKMRKQITQKPGRKKNTGIPYEIAVQRIFQEILDCESARTIKVEHNVQVQGQSLSHQIDVLWSFSIAGMNYLTIVQAKDWTQAVRQEKVLAFRQILNDIPGQPRGVIITQRGFQRGARKFAADHGIQLFLLRQESIGGTITASSYFSIDIQIKFEPYRMPCGSVGWHIRATAYRPEPQVKLTVERLPKQLGRMQQRSVDRIAKKSRCMVQLFDENKQSLGVVRDVLIEFVETMKKKNQLCETFIKDFPDPTFLWAPDSKRFYRLKSLHAEINIVKEELPPVKMKPPGFVDFVLQDLNTGKKQSFIQPILENKRGRSGRSSKNLTRTSRCT